MIMKKIDLCRFLVLTFVLLSLSAFIYAQRNILFLGSQSTPDIHMADKDALDTLTALGCTVTYMDDGDYAALDAGDLSVWDGMHGFYISEPVSSGTTANFREDRHNYPVPCMNLEGWTPRADVWGWINDNNTEFYRNDPGTEDDKSIIIMDNSHYITEIYDVDQEVVWTTTTYTESNLPGGVMEVNVEFSDKLAQIKGYEALGKEDFWTMFTIDSAAGLPNRMFVWGMHEVGLNGTDASAYLEHTGTEDFWKIFRRAAQWTFNMIPKEPGETSVKENYLDDYSMHAFPNPASGIANIRFLAAEPDDATVTLFNVTGQQVKVLYDKRAKAGYNFVSFDTGDYPAGIYFAILQIGEHTLTTKIFIE
jgi:hypothetical protein